jgi:hypothetical protein
MPGVDFLLVREGGERIASKGWAARESHPAAPQIAAAYQADPAVP